jgi:hypothetical protein
MFDQLSAERLHAQTPDPNNNKANCKPCGIQMLSNWTPWSLPANNLQGPKVIFKKHDPFDKRKAKAKEGPLGGGADMNYKKKFSRPNVLYQAAWRPTSHSFLKAEVALHYSIFGKVLHSMYWQNAKQCKKWLAFTAVQKYISGIFVNIYICI